MFKKSYFSHIGSPPQMAFMAIPLTLQHPLAQTHVLASSSAPFTNNIHESTVVHSNIKILELFFEIYFFRKNYLRQPSIDFDFCNLSSSGDVVYKERW